MSKLAEHCLYLAAKLLYRTEIAHSQEMKDAMQDAQQYDVFRASQLQRVIDAANAHGVPLRGHDVLDLGCGEGALTGALFQQGPRRMIGVDIDPSFVERARRTHTGTPMEFVLGTVSQIPLPDQCVDTIVAFDVFEHVARPLPILEECRRLLRPGGKMLIGTCGWHNPFAPHLWATMPVPWAHVLFSERTLLKTCRRVYRSSWYVPNQFDFDTNGNLISDKYSNVSISSEYLNKFLLSDFEATFAETGFDFEMHLQPFSSRWARWSKPFLKLPVLRELLHSYFWAVLTNPKTEDDADKVQNRNVVRVVPLKAPASRAVADATLVGRISN